MHILIRRELVAIGRTLARCAAVVLLAWCIKTALLAWAGA